MANKSWNKLRGVVRPVLGPEPILIQLCRAFIDNLRLILNVTMVVGAVFLAQELRESQDDPVVDAEQPAVAEEAPQEIEAGEPVLTDGVLHALNCTYENYRKEHYAECVEDPSEFYVPPEADADDAGFLYDAPVVLMASLETP